MPRATASASISEDVRGSAGFGDTLTGNAGGNRLIDLGGADTLNGLAGADVLVGGDGNDVLRRGVVPAATP